MNFLKGISLFCVCALAILTVGILGQIIFPEETVPQESETVYETATYIFVPKAVLSESQETVQEEEPYYYLDVEGNEIVVYQYGEDTIFMNTGMLFDEMTESLKNEIKEHKIFHSIEEVYDFLESYSS